MKTMIPRLWLCLLVAAAAACSTDTPTTPDTTTPAVTTTEFFSGTLEIGGTQRHLFSTVATGTATMTLAGLSDTSGAVVNPLLTIGLGVPADGGVCTLSNSGSFHPSLVTQLSLSVVAGSYCVSISDAGTLSGTSLYNIRVVHP